MKNIKAKIYIAKTENTIIRKIFIYIDGAEFSREFYSKKTLKEMINFLKFQKIPLELNHANYNCSYMDLPF
jgi:hypothetical protein